MTVLKTTAASVRLLAVSLLLGACASTPDMVSTETEAGETYSADEVRRTTVDQPFLLSGDYFRERSRRGMVSASDLLSGSETSDRGEKQADAPKTGSGKTPEAASEKADGPAALNPPQRAEPSPEPAPSSSGAEMPVKVALVFDPQAVPADRVAGIMGAADALTGNGPLILADGGKIREVLTHTECLRKKDLGCLTNALGVYPGARMVLLFEAFSVPDDFPGPAAARVSMADTGIGYRYPAMEVRVTLGTPADVERFIRGTLSQVFNFALEKRKIMPWFCRTFSQEENRWFLSAGARSGLKVGDPLKIVEGGTLVKSPAGLPAGWLPGPTRGTVRVETLFGDDLAACSRVDGREPRPGDLLMPE